MTLMPSSRCAFNREKGAKRIRLEAATGGSNCQGLTVSRVARPTAAPQAPAMDTNHMVTAI